MPRMIVLWANMNISNVGILVTMIDAKTAGVPADCAIGTALRVGATVGAVARSTGAVAPPGAMGVITFCGAPGSTGVVVVIAAGVNTAAVVALSALYPGITAILSAIFLGEGFLLPSGCTFPLDGT